MGGHSRKGTAAPACERRGFTSKSSSDPESGASGGKGAREQAQAGGGRGPDSSPSSQRVSHSRWLGGNFSMWVHAGHSFTHVDTFTTPAWRPGLSILHSGVWDSFSFLRTLRLCYSTARVPCGCQVHLLTSHCLQIHPVLHKDPIETSQH